MGYLVVSCPTCGTPRVAEAQHRTTACAACSKRIELGRALVHLRTPSLAAAREAVGHLNAKRAGGELLAAEPTGAPPEPADAIDEAIADARSVRNETMRVRLAAEGLGARLATWDEETWCEALARLDVERGRALEHLERLVETSAVAQPRPGTFRYVG